MTIIFFVRHAQPNESWQDDRTKPLTELGLNDSKKVTEVLKNFHIDVFLSSPYKRSYDTIADCAKKFNMTIHTDERLRERKGGINKNAFVEKRWEDFNFCEQNGENLASVQKRNIEALKEILHKYKNKTLVIGTHGTALSTILNYYDNSFNCDSFKKIWYCMPYIIQLDFEQEKLVSKKELLSLERGY